MGVIDARMADPEFVAALPKTKTEAKLSNTRYYFTGVPCKHGHNSYRSTRSGECNKCHAMSTTRTPIQRSTLERKAIIKASSEKYRNSEKGKQAQRKWRKSEGCKASRARWKDKDPEWAWALAAVWSARRRASKAAVAFNLTNEYVRSILPSHCPVFGTPFMYQGNKKTGAESPSVDRLKPELGYVLGNIAIISLKANAIKQNANAEEIQKVADWLKLQETKL